VKILYSGKKRKKNLVIAQNFHSSRKTVYLEVKFREIKPQNYALTGLLHKMETFQKQHKYHFDSYNYFT